MKRIALALAIVASVSLGIWWESAAGTPVTHAEAGPTVSVGLPTGSGDNLLVPISATGSGFSPFAGLYIHLRWDPAKFMFAGMDRHAGLFGGASAACENPVADAGGGGAWISCYFPQAGSISTGGLLVTVLLTPLQTGCSLLHLATAGAPDYAVPGTFTFTRYGANQTNSYADRTSTHDGSSCVAGSPTPGTTLISPTNTATPTSTPTGGATPTPIDIYVGPSIVVGSPTFDGSAYGVAIRTDGTGFNPYRAFNVHLRWDANLFAFSDVSASGSLFDPSVGGRMCMGPFVDSDGGGVMIACLLFGAQYAEYSQTGLLTTVSLNPLQFGCSALHLFTAGPPDGGDTSTGTYTTSDEIFGNPQHNLYVDNAVCNDPPPTPTSTPIPCAIRAADVNHDGKVTFTDLVLVARYYNEAGAAAAARLDQNADGKIALADLVIMAGVYNQSVSACP
jgi:hypothetical protein